MRMKPPPTPNRPPSSPPRNPIAAKTARRLYRGPHELTPTALSSWGSLFGGRPDRRFRLAHDDRVMPELHTRLSIDARLLGLLRLLLLAALLVAAFTHGAQFPRRRPVRA